MLVQNFGVTKKERYGMLWYFLEWSIAVTVNFGLLAIEHTQTYETYRVMWKILNRRCKHLPFFKKKLFADIIYLFNFLLNIYSILGHEVKLIEVQFTLSDSLLYSRAAGAHCLK